MPGEDPVYESQVSPQVTQASGMPMNATPSAFGAGVGNAEETSGEVLTKIHHDALEEANQTAILDAKNKNDAFLNDHLYDAKKGLLYQELGKNAPSAVDQTLADFDTHTSAVSNGLANDQQRAMYQRLVVSQRFDLQRQLQAYEHRETSRYADETDNAALANSAAQATRLAGAYSPTYVEHADGTKSLNNTDDIVDQIKAGQAIIQDRGERKGQAPGFIKEQQDHYASEVHSQAIEQMSSVGNDQAAKLWYDHFKDSLIGNDADRAAKLVQAGSLNGQALRVSDKIVLDQDGISILPRADIDARVRQIQDPQLRERVQENVDRRLAQHRQEVDEQQKAITDQTLQLVQDSKLGISDPQVQTNLQQLDPERQQAIRRFAAKPMVQADPAAMRAIQLGLADPSTRAQWVSFDPTTQPDKYGRDDMEKISGWQATYLKGGDEANKEMAGTLTRSTAVRHAIDAAGLDKASKQDQDAAANAIDQQIVAIENATGKKLLPEDVEKAATALLVKRAYFGEHWYNRDQRPSQFTADQLDPAERQRISDSLVKAGIPATDDNVLSAYRTNLGMQAIRGANGQ